MSVESLAIRFPEAARVYDITSLVGWFSAFGLAGASVAVKRWSSWLCGLGWTVVVLWITYYAVLPRF